MDKETSTYVPEGEVQSVYPGSVGVSREDKDVMAGRILYSKGDAVHMVGMGGRFALFLFGVSKGVQARHEMD